LRGNLGATGKVVVM